MTRAVWGINNNGKFIMNRGYLSEDYVEACKVLGIKIQLFEDDKIETSNEKRKVVIDCNEIKSHSDLDLCYPGFRST